jgi:hypothetical protein
LDRGRGPIKIEITMDGDSADDALVRAVCLSSLTAGLRRGSLRIARELQREKSIERVIECERRDRGKLCFVVVTDEVYLTDRLVRGNNGVLVLSYAQLTTMW